MAMVEMVFVLPLLLLLVFAIAELGLMFSRWLTLSNAVREGARLAVVYREDCDAGTVQGEVQTRVTNYAQAGGIPGGQLVFNEVTVCNGSDPAVVRVTYRYPFQVLPGFSTLGATINLQYASSMRNE